jgi:GT2 family glycosyltransferase/glycosyltransferase involved in cell wall biosynthesis
MTTRGAADNSRDAQTNRSNLNATGPDPHWDVTLLPEPDPEELQALESRLPAAGARKHDVVCFSIIDWNFRYQRPQQLMSSFASNGHRVFYIFLNPDAGLHEDSPATLVKENVYEVRLASGPLNIYTQVIEGELSEFFGHALAELRRQFRINEAVCYVMISSWTEVALDARTRWGWPIIYDCMDEWKNFPGVSRSLIDSEERLVRECDLLVTTSELLYRKWQPYARRSVLARNGVDPKFYLGRYVPNSLIGATTKPIVGYFGAIADWFDVELVAEAARLRPQYDFVLLGGVFDADVSSLEQLPNVHMLGQQPYETMPEYLYHFDACVIPFKINSITEATDPVKVYEYLMSGKPVVSTALPELEPYREYVYIANGPEDFCRRLDAALAENEPGLAQRRRRFAATQSWDSRYEQIESAVASTVPLASIVVITYNNLLLNRLCLETVMRNTEYPNYEIIVVDNGSTDGTQRYLKYLASRCRNVRIILNAENQGFARANNQGIRTSAGDFIVLLNNDTVVPPGWLSRLVRHLDRPDIGIVGPVTNFAGNEAKISVWYNTVREMESFALDQMWIHDGQIADIPMLAMFCLAMRRDTIEKVGELDEQFGIGMFEDDDYAQRVRAQGLRVVCAADVFVHHVGQASFKKLIETGQYDGLFEENRRRYETKWKIRWEPHQHRPLKFEAARAGDPRIDGSTDRHDRARVEPA